jgi:hypothetical protein
MALQTQLMQRMVEAMEHRGNGGNRVAPQDEDLTRKIERFIRLKAPTFSYSDDPLEVDDWLRVIRPSSTSPSSPTRSASLSLRTS